MSGPSARPAGTIDAATRQAAAWFARLRADDVSSSDRAAFEHWLCQDLDHRAAYEKFERFWSKSGSYANERAVAQMTRRLQWPRRTVLWAAAGCVLLMAVGVLLAFQWPGANGVYQTRIGERDTMHLSDGSTVTLNTDTRLRIAYSAHRRLIELEHGQAFFKVARDFTRPFEVATRTGVVRALGTEFEVYQQGEEVLVTLVEGKVLVSEAGRFSGNGPNSETRIGKVLHPGQRLALKPGRSAEVQAAALERSTAWLSGRLVFDDEPLEYAVAEMNRYSKRKIVFGEERLRALRVSGVFRAGEPDDFVKAISGYFAVQARPAAGGGYVLTPMQHSESAH